MARPDGSLDECPVHGTPSRKWYEYAGGITLAVYSGCKCASVSVGANTLGSGGGYISLCQDFADASGVARMAQAIHHSY